MLRTTPTTSLWTRERTTLQLLGGDMVKRHGRPSLQYRYEHYDPRM
jgi:hypothetical protein